MRVVVDAFGIKPGSIAIILENLLRGWSELDLDDTITVLTEAEPPCPIPDGVAVHRVAPPWSGNLGTVWLRSVGLRRAASRLRAEGVVSLVAASGLAGSAGPRVAVLPDLRHELRPHQFSRARRAVRRLTYDWTFRTADAVFCISHRTRQDLVTMRPWMEDRAKVAWCGADHVDQWPEPVPAADRYALAFGQFENKNVDEVLHAWALFCRQNTDMILRLVAMSAADRHRCSELVVSLGIADRVELMPWLDDEQFQQCFSRASLVVFPSDFEGFGLPVVEALRQRIPVVISTDPALLEVSGEHAVIAADVRPETLSSAMTEAMQRTPEQLAAGRAHTDRFRWSEMANTIRGGLFPG